MLDSDISCDTCDLGMLLKTLDSDESSGTHDSGELQYMVELKSSLGIGIATTYLFGFLHL